MFLQLRLRNEIIMKFIHFHAQSAHPVWTGEEIWNSHNDGLETPLNITCTSCAFHYFLWPCDLTWALHLTEPPPPPSPQQKPPHKTQQQWSDTYRDRHKTHKHTHHTHRHENQGLSFIHQNMSIVMTTHKSNPFQMRTINWFFSKKKKRNNLKMSDVNYSLLLRVKERKHR